jgi:glycosyltransferase involved in cell wall biosynthesis
MVGSNMIDFSAVIPTFRRPVELTEALRSVLSQEGVNVEAIVVDDSPEGSSGEVIEALNDSRITYIKNPEPTGGNPALVRNMGWPKAKGSFVHFLDDDDVVPVGHYKRAKEAFLAHPEVGVVFGRIEPFGLNEATLEPERQYFSNAAHRARKAARFGPRLAYAANMYFHSTMIVCSTCQVRRECVEILGGFDNGSRLVEDVEFYARAMRRFGAHFMDEVVLHYRIGASIMHSRTNDDAIVKTYRRMHDRYRREAGPLEFFAMKAFSRFVLPALQR